MSRDPPLDEAAERFADAYNELIKYVENGAHGLLRGTMEESITSQQSAAMLGGDAEQIDHYKSLRNSLKRLTDLKSDLGEARRDLNLTDPIAFWRIEDVFKQSIEYCLSFQKVQSETKELVESIASSTAQTKRLEGLAFETLPRSFSALVSTQIQDRKYQEFFKDRKIPCMIYPDWTPKVANLDKHLRQTAITSLEIGRRLAPMKTAIDREINRPTTSFVRGAPALSAVYTQFRKRF